MAATAAITIQGSIIGTASGERRIGPITLSSVAANGMVQQIALASGANTITVPTAPAPSGCIIVLNPINTVVTTLKGASGDTGIAIGKTTTTVLNWDATAVPATFVLSSASPQTGIITEIIFF
jgi:hypothetical protein